MSQQNIFWIEFRSWKWSDNDTRNWVLSFFYRINMSRAQRCQYCYNSSPTKYYIKYIEKPQPSSFRFGANSNVVEGHGLIAWLDYNKFVVVMDTL